MPDRAQPVPYRAATLGALALALIGVVGAGVWALRSLSAPPAPAIGATSMSGADALLTADAAVDAARRYIESQQPGPAEAILRRAIERIPSNQQLHFLLGEALLSQGRPAEAYDEYDRAILIGPDHPEYRHAAATIAAGLGRLSDAELHYRAAQSMEPANPKYPLYLAQVQRKGGMIDEARASLVVATRLDPDLAIGWGSLAAIAIDEGRLSVASGYLDKAIALEPERTEWRLLRARILRRQNQPQEAATALLALPQGVRESDKSVILELALCYGLLSRPKDAAALYTGAVAKFPDDPEMSYQAALWLERAGEAEQSRTYAALAAGQGHEGAKRLAASGGGG